MVLLDRKIEIFPGINDTPIPPTNIKGGNGAHLLKEFNSLIDDILANFSAYNDATLALDLRLSASISSVASINTAQQIEIDNLKTDVATLKAANASSGGSSGLSKRAADILYKDANIRAASGIFALAPFHGNDGMLIQDIVQINGGAFSLVTGSLDIDKDRLRNLAPGESIFYIGGGSASPLYHRAYMDFLPDGLERGVYFGRNSANDYWKATVSMDGTGSVTMRLKQTIAGVETTKASSTKTSPLWKAASIASFTVYCGGTTLTSSLNLGGKDFYLSATATSASISTGVGGLILNGKNTYAYYYSIKTTAPITMN